MSLPTSRSRWYSITFFYNLMRPEEFQYAIPSAAPLVHTVPRAGSKKAACRASPLLLLLQILLLATAWHRVTRSPGGECAYPPSPPAVVTAMRARVAAEAAPDLPRHVGLQPNTTGCRLLTGRTSR